MSEKAQAQYVVGIDLGTTNTVVASFSIAAAKRAPVDPEVFPINQRVTATEEEARPLFPSCLYAPIRGEIPGDPDWVPGEVARVRGAEVAGRFVSSAKSWLCHSGVDRLAPILPWGASADPTLPRISPLDASTRYLAHVKATWDEAHPKAPLASQEVILTVPASFDEIARELTLKAATAAGLSVTLVEEPTAAFYDAMRDGRGKKRSNDAWDRLLGRVKKKDLEEGKAEQFVLVVDVGGGTTDLSLMAVGARSQEKRDREEAPIRRVATGRHILLGGDNMDLALAHVAETRLAGQTQLEAMELAQLVVACRRAKERIFDGAREAKVTLLGRGGKLVSGSRSATFTKKDLDTIVIEGFFPVVEKDAPLVRTRAGLVSFGLPYERDVAITRHVAQFLSRHADEMGGRGLDAVLLNGGVFRAERIAEALVSVIEGWGGRAPVILPNSDPDLAVARGAVLYGFARRGIGVKVSSGASRGYYVALDTWGNEKRAVCILPRGAEEGAFAEAAGKTFELVVGKSVRFDLYASDVRKDEAGALVVLAKDKHGDEETNEEFERMPPLVAAIPAGKKAETTVPVTLGGVLLPTGQLALSCSRVSAEPGPRARYDLQFSLRSEGRSAFPSGPEGRAIAPPPSIAPAPSQGRDVPHAKLEEAHRLIERVFGKRTEADPRDVKDLLRELERVLGDRMTWSLVTVRSIADMLLGNPGARRRSPNHERAFFMIAGFCLRPGFGDPRDAERIRVFSTLFEGRLAFPDEPRCWAQFFIAFRRAAGGLSEATQLDIRAAFDPVIAPRDANLKKPKRMPDGIDELCMLLATLDRVPVSRREQLGGWLIERSWTHPDARLWSAIGRVGARAPLFAGVDHVVPANVAEKWTEQLLRVKWQEIATAPHTAVQLARVTGDRARDLSPRIRAEVEKRLIEANGKPEWIRAVKELVVVDEAERVAMMGEGLPLGLRLSS